MAAAIGWSAPAANGAHGRGAGGWGRESPLPTALVDAGADADSAANLGGEPAVASIDGGSSSTGGSIVGSEGPDEGPAVERLK